MQESIVIPIVGDAYKEFSTNLDAQTLINFYVMIDKDGKFPTALYPTPGLGMFSAGAAGQKSVRCLLEKNNSLYAVIDNKLYLVSRVGDRRELGTLNTSIGRVQIIDNGYQLEIIDGTFGYIYKYRENIDGKPTSDFSVIDDENYIPPNVITYQDGYAIYPVRGTFKFYWSNVFDFSKITATDFNRSGTYSENLVSIISIHEEVWIFNRATAEIFFNSGDPDTIFKPREGLTVEYGCAAPYSVVRTQDNALIWLALNKYGDSLVVMATGYAPQIISTPAITARIADFDTIDDAWAFSYQKRKHIFYVLVFPSEDQTFVYDLETTMWHEWKSQIIKDLPTGQQKRLGRFRGNAYAFLDGLHIIGDYANGNLYYLSDDIYTENGEEIIRERTLQHLQNKLRRTSIYNLQIDIESGVGLDTGLGEEPQIMLQISKDGAHTWSNEYWRTAGKIGEYRWRAKWLSLGQAYDWVFRIRVSDPVKWVILGATADIETE